MRKCRRQLDSDPDGLGEPYPEKPAGMSAARYAYLLDRLDAAEDDLGLPLIPAGLRSRLASLPRSLAVNTRLTPAL